MLWSMSDVTRILSAIEAGDTHAAEQLLPLVYDELRKLAAQRLAREKPGQTLNATALGQDAAGRPVSPAPPANPWTGRLHSFAPPAEAMRRILVETARRKLRQRHGGGQQRHDVVAFEPPCPQTPHELVALSDALDQL